MWGHTRCCCCHIYNVQVLWARAYVTSSDITMMKRCCGRYSVTNYRCDVGLSVRCFHLLSSNIGVDFRRSMCRPSEIDDRCVNLRRSMCRPSRIEDRCVGLPSMIDVKLCCYTCSKHWYYSCMRISPRVCTSVLSFLICDDLQYICSV